MRIALVIRWLGYLIAASVVIYTLIYARSDLFLLFGVAAAWAGAGWVLAWIIEGFAKTKT